MKFATEQREVESFGSISTKKITLSANAKAFRIIFGQIYPDIIKAIVRELFTNAWDSQKVAGTLDTPIDIHLPTKWEPYFSIRDYGVGMSPTQIDNIYSKVFESSKDQSDDEAGMFGMGSKTPLGYTDSFTVVSYVDGHFWSYDVYLDNTGSPVITLVAQGETDEPNGVSVTVSVDEKDFDTFKLHAERFALNAGTAININRKTVINNTEPLFKGDGWVVLKQTDLFDNGIYVRMGCVLYQIKFSMLNSYLNYNERDNIEWSWKTPVIIDFPIGTFNVTGSREDITYTKEAAQLIYNRLEQVVGDAVDQYHEQLKDCTLTQAYRLYQNTSSLFRERRNKMVICYKSWNMRHLSSYIQHVGKDVEVMYDPNHPYGRKTIRFKHQMFETDMYTSNQPIYFIIDDKTTKNAPARIANIASYRRTIAWIRVDSEKQPRRIKAIAPDNTIWVNIADIDPVKKQPREKSKEVTVRCLSGVDLSQQTVVTSKLGYDIEDYTHYVYHEKGDNWDYQKIHHAVMALDIPYSDVAIIGKTNLKYVAEYELLDLFEEAEKTINSIDYDDDAYYFHASLDNNQYYAWLFSTRYYGGRIRDQVITSKLIGRPLVDDDPTIKFIKDINPTVDQKYKAIYDQINQKIEDLYVRHPILKFISISTMTDAQVIEILTTLGEM